MNIRTASDEVSGRTWAAAGIDVSPHDTAAFIDPGATDRERIPREPRARERGSNPEAHRAEVIQTLKTAASDLGVR